MLLISNEQLISYQEGYIPIFEKYIEKLKNGPISSEELTVHLEYISSLVKLALIGEYIFTKYLSYANNIIGDIEKCKWFLTPRSREEIIEFCKNI